MNDSRNRTQGPIRTIRAVCVDTLTLRNVATDWGRKDQVKIVFETEELKGNGYPRTASRTFNISLYEKAVLRGALEAWLGRKITASEMLNGFPFDGLVGKAAEIEVQDARTDDGMAFLRIISIRPTQARPLAPSGSYRRWGEPTAIAKAPQPLVVRADRTEPVAERDQQPGLGAQFGCQPASTGEPGSPESPYLPDNAEALPVTARN